MSNLDNSLAALKRIQNGLDQIKLLVEMEQELRDFSPNLEVTSNEAKGQSKRRVSNEEIANMLEDKYVNKMWYRDIADKYERPIHTVIEVIKRERSEAQKVMDLDITQWVPEECIIKHPKKERMARLCQLYYSKDLEGRPRFKKREIEDILREEGYVVKNGTFQQVYNYVDPNRRCCFGYYDDDMKGELDHEYFDEQQSLMDEIGAMLIDRKVDFWKIMEINKILAS